MSFYESDISSKEERFKVNLAMKHDCIVLMRRSSVLKIERQMGLTEEMKKKQYNEIFCYSLAEIVVFGAFCIMSLVGNTDESSDVEEIGLKDLFSITSIKNSPKQLPLFLLPQVLFNAMFLYGMESATQFEIERFIFSSRSDICLSAFSMFVLLCKKIIVLSTISMDENDALKLDGALYLGVAAIKIFTCIYKISATSSLLSESSDSNTSFTIPKILKNKTKE